MAPKIAVSEKTVGRWIKEWKNEGYLKHYGNIIRKPKETGGDK